MELPTASATVRTFRAPDSSSALAAVHALTGRELVDLALPEARPHR